MPSAHQKHYIFKAKNIKNYISLMTTFEVSDKHSVLERVLLNLKTFV